MFERFTDRARRCVVFAQEEARGLGHDFIGTEHLLLGLIREGNGLAAKALEGVGVDAVALRQRVTELAGTGAGSESGHIPFTGPAKQVLRLSLAQAQALGHHYIGTEHVLLGLMEEKEGVAARALAGAGADASRVRAEVVRLLAEYQRRAKPDAPEGQDPGAGGGGAEA